MKSYAYIRVSTAEQNEDRQLMQIKKMNIPSENIFIDKQSGKNFERPAYKSLMRQITAGDILFVTSIDRLGRNYTEIQKQWHIITKQKKADICIMDMPLLDTRNGKDLLGTFIADLVLQILSFVAETEHKNIKERQIQGIIAAKERGVKFGRPRKSVPKNFMQLCDDYYRGKISLSQILQTCNISKSTFYRLQKNL